MFTLYVTYNDGRKESVGTFDNTNETYDRYIKGVEQKLFKWGEVFNTATNKLVERYF
jgi:hypothetical protein